MGLVVVVVFVASAVAGHSTSAKDDPVAGYVGAVDALQQRLRVPLTQVQSAYARYARTGKSPTVAELAGTERTLKLVDRRLAALPAPPAAARLRTLLLDLLRRETSLAAELDGLARFTPRFHAVALTAERANSTLVQKVARVATPKPRAVRGTLAQIAKAKAAFAEADTAAAAAQADALDGYGRTLGRLVTRLRALRPPPLMAPAYRAELRTLRATQAAGAALAHELRKRNRTRVPALSRRLAEAARLSASVPAQRSEVAAVKAYDARVRAVSADLSRISAEVSRLQRETG